MSDSPSSGGNAATDLVGQMAGEYRLQKKLGEGGFGAVYQAEHPVLKRRAAVKVLHQAARMDSDAVQRFISEAQAANQIRSRHIVDIFSFGTLADGRPFYVMDLLDGEPLDRHLDREKRLEVPAALQLLTPLVEALDAAHAAGIVHRDLKPQNIFLVWESTGETVPKLLDFGTAKLLAASPVQTVTGTPVGTPLYMSPEQARGEKVDARADVYALGVLCHELLTGELPINGPSTIAILMAHVSQVPKPVSRAAPDLSAELDAPILRMLEKDPKARPATAGEALAELARAAERGGYGLIAGLPKLRRPRPPTVRSLTDTPTVRADSPAVGSDKLAVEVSTARTRLPDVGGWQRRVWKGAGMLSLLGLVATVVIYLTSSFHGPTAPSEVAPSRAASASVPAAPPASTPPAPPATPATIDLTVLGAPRGARVSFDGKAIGDAPGPLVVRFANSAIELVVSAAGHESRKVLVVPNQNLSVNVPLAKRPSGTARPRRQIPTDLESPF